MYLKLPSISILTGKKIFAIIILLISVTVLPFMYAMFYVFVYPIMNMVRNVTRPKVDIIAEINKPLPVKPIPKLPVFKKN
jgi:hypothetical protein